MSRRPPSPGITRARVLRSHVERVDDPCEGKYVVAVIERHAARSEPRSEIGVGELAHASPASARAGHQRAARNEAADRNGWVIDPSDQSRKTGPISPTMTSSGREVAVVESVGYRACRKRSTRGHEVRFTRPQRRGLVGRQTGRTAEPKEAIVSRATPEPAPPVQRTGRGATPASSSAVQVRGEHALQLRHAGQRRGPRDRSSAHRSASAPRRDRSGSDPVPASAATTGGAAPGSMSAISSVSAISWAKIPGTALAHIRPRAVSNRDTAERAQTRTGSSGPTRRMPAFGQPGVRPGRHIGPPRRVVVRNLASREPGQAHVGRRLQGAVGHVPRTIARTPSSERRRRIEPGGVVVPGS